MAYFSATEFIFNNVSCKYYGLTLAIIGDNGTIESTSQKINYLYTRLPRRQQIYNYGVTNTDILKFEMEFYCETNLSAEKQMEITSWLSNSGEFGKLEIVQEDLLYKYFKVMFTKITAVYIGRLCYGFKVEIECDSPYCYGEINTYSFTSGTNSFIIPNVSASFIPIPFSATFTLSSGTTLSLSNSTTAETMTITSLVSNDIISLNTDLQIVYITNRPSIKLVNYFTGDFIKLAQGKNSFSLSSGNASISLSYTPVFTIGG